MTTMLAPSVAAGKDWAARARGEGVSDIKARGSVLEIVVLFDAGDVGGYAMAENLAHDFMMEVPVVEAGSIWGTTSDGVGGFAALDSGRMRLKQSGVSKRFAKGAAS